MFAQQEALVLHVCSCLHLGLGLNAFNVAGWLFSVWLACRSSISRKMSASTHTYTHTHTHSIQCPWTQRGMNKDGPREHM